MIEGRKMNEHRLGVILWLGLILLCFNGMASAQELLLEAERFAQPGGWVLDQQFMDQMGSPYLLAHGLGRPVADAVTPVSFPGTGTYRVWVRTYDWISPWRGQGIPPAKRAYGSPGRFQVLVNGMALGATFGARGSEWFWQDGGTVNIDHVEATVALHDLTGFEGRCDAILFTMHAASPPNQDPDMRLWRKGLMPPAQVLTDAGDYDLVVVGGGMAGMCASLQGARLGLQVALIQDRPVLGGNNSGEVRVWLNGGIKREPYPEIGNLVKALEPEKRAHYGPANTADLYEDQQRIDLFNSEENLSLFLQCRVNAVDMDGSRIQAVVAEHTVTGESLRFTGKTFADCTGDGCVGFLAGADYELTPFGHMGRCNLWNVRDTGSRVAFPSCEWALNLAGKPFPFKTNELGVWYWESGFDLDPFARSEYIRDWNFRAMYGAWDALKNARKLYPNHELNWAAYVSGKRESRRLLGEIILTQEDFVQGVAYDDGFVPTTWNIDLHLPNPSYEKGFEGDAFISKAHYTGYPKPFWLPYRCLYSRNINNLFMAGRDISVTHEALGAVRVMRTGGMMGEVVGMAASVCKKFQITPREVYTDHLADLRKLVTHGVRISNWNWWDHIAPNLARSAAVEVSSFHDALTYPAKHVNDGLADTSDVGARWLSSRDYMPDTVTLTWDTPVMVSACRIVSGWNSGNGPTDPIEDFSLQFHDGQVWRSIEAASVKNNARTDWRAAFPVQKSRQFRVLVTKTPGNISRFWEIELYHPGADINKDGQVDSADLKLLTQDWLLPVTVGESCASDLDHSQWVDMNDLGILGLFWNWPFDAD